MNAMTLVLVVEDNFEIATLLEGFLRQHGYRTERALDGQSALTLFRQVKPDLVLLDVMLPKLDGVEVLKCIRQESHTPVILLTARSEELDKLLGLELGADDYITKPFRPLEVMARVKAVLRRTQPNREALADMMRLGDLEIDMGALQATVQGQPLLLTATEFRLLVYLAQNVKRTFSREQLLEAVLPDSDAQERVMDVHIGNLRRKLEASDTRAVIQTVRGMGFRLEVV